MQKRNDFLFDGTINGTFVYSLRAKERNDFPYQCKGKRTENVLLYLILKERFLSLVFFS